MGLVFSWRMAESSIKRRRDDASKLQGVRLIN